MKYIIALLSLISASLLLHAQSPSAKVDVKSGIATGDITYTITTLDMGSIEAMFDGDSSTIARTPDISPMVITLGLTQPVALNQAALYELTDGTWSLETAANLADLNAMTGTYQAHFTNVTVAANTWSTQPITPNTAGAIRLTIHRTACCDDYVHVGEIRLTQQVTNLCIAPQYPNLDTGMTYDLVIAGEDLAGNVLPLIDQTATWSSQYPPAATVDANGLVTTNTIGNQTIITAIAFGDTFTTQVSVGAGFWRDLAPTRIVKVALVLQNPPIPSYGNQTFAQYFNWFDPTTLANRMRDSLTQASGGVVDYQIIATYDDTLMYTRMGGNLLSRDSLAHLLSEPGWTTLNTNGTQFDYNLMLDTHGFCTQSNAHQIDEVWVYSMPYGGMYESQLTGNGAFWLNSPPLSGNSCTDQLTIMGLNYERDLAEAIHSYGHRVESTMLHVYGRWDANAPTLNNWEKFASYDLTNPAAAHMGNIHYPPNGTSDYDYANTNPVTTYADNWKDYPFLSDRTRTITCTEWDCDHLGYMMWWHRHLPHFTCKDNTGILNNWWAYVVDYNEGVAAAKAIPLCGCYPDNSVGVVAAETEETILVFPVPAGEAVHIRFGEEVYDATIRIVNLAGQRVVTQEHFSGQDVVLDISGLAAGVYGVQVLTGEGVLTSKLVKCE